MVAAAFLVVFFAAAATFSTTAAMEPCAVSESSDAVEQERDYLESCQAKSSTSLIQFNMKSQKGPPKRAHPADSKEEKEEEELPKEKEKEKEAKGDSKKSSALMKILKRAKELSKASQQPFEYLLDVDYLHDADNPLDNDFKQSSKHPSAPSAHPTLEADWHGKEVYHRPMDHRSFLECVTRPDARAVESAFSSIAKPGSRCIFGVDERDEGSHCIMSGGDYGSHGWCYTKKDRSTWGSCSEGCPLSGYAALVETRIDAVDNMVSVVLEKVRKKADCGSEGRRRRRRRRKPEALAEVLTEAQKMDPS